MRVCVYVVCMHVCVCDRDHIHVHILVCVRGHKYAEKLCFAQHVNL